MADKQPEEKDDFIELVKKLWSPIIGIIGAITSLINFYQLWLGNQESITYIFAGSGFLFLIVALVWIGFSKKDIPKRGNRKALRSVHRYGLLYRRIAWSGLGILILLAVFGAYSLIQHRKEQENKLIVLIASFEGPEDVYGLRNEIIENLNADFSNDENIEIISLDEIITVSKGSEYARKLGGNHLADIVIWGWYRPTENPNINIHIENLSPNQLASLGESESFQPVTTISELESFSFQQQTGKETSALISFLAGLIEYQSEDYQNAIKYFDNSLANLPASLLLFENKLEIYLYRATANIYMGKYEDVIQDFDNVIQINPQDTTAYINRGVAYGTLGEYEIAIQNFDKVIQINPQDIEAYYNRAYAYGLLGKYELAIQDYGRAIQINSQYLIAYNNRGIAYATLGEYDLAIQDFDQAIQINPQFVTAYTNRGNTYYDLKEYEHAVKDYSQAIQINPQYTTAYVNRGFTYFYLDKYELAIQDFDKAIQINPQLALAYNNRGLAYQNLGEYELAIQDFNKAIQINPQLAAGAYYNRGLAYQALGKTAEAEADFAKYKELTGQDAP